MLVRYILLHDLFVAIEGKRMDITVNITQKRRAPSYMF